MRLRRPNGRSVGGVFVRPRPLSLFAPDSLSEGREVPARFSPPSLRDPNRADTQPASEPASPPMVYEPSHRRARLRIQRRKIYSVGHYARRGHLEDRFLPRARLPSPREGTEQRGTFSSLFLSRRDAAVFNQTI